VVAAGHPETVQAAVDVLDAGGNAFDATVAAGFAAAVTEPGLTSLGGGGFLLAHTSDGSEILFDFFVDTPGRGRSLDDLEPHFTPITVRFKGADQVFHAGYGSVAVPGCLAGYLHVHGRLGRLDRDVITAPARRLADEGVLINEQQAQICRLLRGIFTLTEEGRSVFCPDGHFPDEGDVLEYPTLASFLADVGAGQLTGFDDPTLAGAIEAQMTDHAGLLTAADLAAYRVVEREPLELGYRGTRIVTNGPPSFGGSIVGRGLATLEDLAFGELDRPRQAVALAGVLRAMSDDHGAGARLRARQGTTHISVADGEGNVAAMTTSNGSCSGVFAPATGVQLNNIMGEDDLHPGGFHSTRPGERVGSMMAPTLLQAPDGRLIALGSGGSERIRSAITQIVVNVVDHRMALDAAVEAPRLHWDGSTLQVEPGFGPAVDAALAEWGPVNAWTDRDLYFGGAHTVSTAGEAAGDPRRGGSTAVLFGGR
jgi:gamma-glutamyltranspeptidase/glutathione hydrolase